MSNCENVWVYYDVNFERSNDYIMQVKLKHDAGCESENLFYKFKVDNGFYT